MESNDTSQVSKKTGEKILSWREASEEVKRLNSIYRAVARKNGFSFIPAREFILDFTTVGGGSYFHQFREPRLPAPLDMFYSHDEKRFSLGMGMNLDGTTGELKDNWQQRALTRLTRKCSVFIEFHKFLENQGYQVKELTASESFLDYDYHGIKAQTLDDVKGLSTFLGKVETYLYR